MTFKAIAAALTLLLVLAGATYNRAAATHAASLSMQHRRLELGMAEPALAHAGAGQPSLFSGVVGTAKQVGRSARTHVPEPQTLFLLGLVLLVFGLRRRGTKQDRNHPPGDR